MKTHTTLRTALLLPALALPLLSNSAHANLVTNGSFELTTATTTISFISTSVSSWSNSDIGELLVMPSWYTNGYLVPGVGVAGALPQTSPDGGNFVFSDGDYHNSPITQTINGLTPGNFYKLSFYQALIQDTEQYVTIPGPVSGRWQVSLGSNTQLSAFMTGDGSTLTFSPWALQTMTFKAQSATETLSFLSVGAGDPPLVGLDGINLMPVPEPDEILLMSLGGLFLATRFFRLKKARASRA